jgi:hypothetical protein
VIALIMVGLLAVSVLVSLAILAWLAACRRWEARADRARIDTEVRCAERRLHGLASQAFASMLEATRGYSEEADE